MIPLRGMQCNGHKIILINFGARKKKTTFCVRIFDISPCVFTQILIGRARWMRNLITHPTSTHSAYFWCHHHVFLGISCFWGSRVHQKYAVWVLVGCGIFWMWNQIPHPTSSPDRNLSKNTGRYVKNTNKKVVFFF